MVRSKKNKKDVSKKVKMVMIKIKHPAYAIINGKVYDYRDKMNKKVKVPEFVAKVLERAYR